MKYGTIGTSWITDSFIKASQKTNDLTLTAVYSRSEKKARQFADTYAVDYVFTDLEQMAKSNVIDCIYIASPNSLHYEQAIFFLKHKKHVICEKPIFSNTNELNEAYKTAEENGVFLFEAIRSIHSPNFKQLKSNISKVSKVRSAILHQIRYSSKYNSYLDGDNPNIFSAEFSGGALVDMGIYPLYLAVALFGKPASVSYVAYKLESGVDGSGTLVLNYGTFTCTVICSKIVTSYIPCEIHGENGTFVFDDASKMNNLTFIDNQTSKAMSIESPDIEEDMVYEIGSFARIIETNSVEEYENLKKLSQIVLSITEEARRQNGIVYACER
ncbi:Gfo/Idh/MocA family protein [Virgibacillus oceani]|uniref:Oxidoreductase n=1 Tax=Virgibacillus oceani TaxID=1479511 RepID=A0A917M1L7_9BACI|nr:Gfo/Idh/MocA family oxidoreductase [Virgibacillus oceani]GGG71551.1 oxidoreductase [Virgibacillus oceani]